MPGLQTKRVVSGKLFGVPSNRGSVEIFSGIFANSGQMEIRFSYSAK